MARAARRSAARPRATVDYGEDHSLGGRPGAQQQLRSPGSAPGSARNDLTESASFRVSSRTGETIDDYRFRGSGSLGACPPPSPPPRHTPPRSRRVRGRRLAHDAFLAPPRAAPPPRAGSAHPRPARRIAAEARQPSSSPRDRPRGGGPGLNPRVASLRESKTMALTDLARSMKESGLVIGLAAGEPDFDTPDAIVEAGCDAYPRGARATPQTPAPPPRARRCARSSASRTDSSTPRTRSSSATGTRRRREEIPSDANAIHVQKVERAPNESRHPSIRRTPPPPSQLTRFISIRTSSPSKPIPVRSSRSPRA